MINSTSTLLLIGLVTFVIVLNLVTTVCVTNSSVYSASQKTLQLVLVWLLPLVGAILVLSVWAHDRKRLSKSGLESGNVDLHDTRWASGYA